MFVVDVALHYIGENMKTLFGIPSNKPSIKETLQRNIPNAMNG